MPGSRSGSQLEGTYRRVYKCVSKSCERRASVSAQPVEAIARELLSAYAGENAQKGGQVDVQAVHAARAALSAAQPKLDEGALPEDDDEAAAIKAVREQARDRAQAAYEAALANTVELGYGPGDVADAGGAGQRLP